MKVLNQASFSQYVSAPRFILQASILAVVCVSAFAASADELILAENGQSAYKIVLADKWSPDEARAEELQMFSPSRSLGSRFRSFQTRNRKALKRSFWETIIICINWNSDRLRIAGPRGLCHSDRGQ